jgi:anhydro-N-acetylmuramic acid kinase
MNPSIKKLARLADKKSRTIIGLMSGTSLDGLDIAKCEVKNSGYQTKVELINFTTKEYSSEQKIRLKSISSIDNINLGELCYQHTWLANVHAGMILDSLREWNTKPDQIDCIASHGQTIYHLPERDQVEVKDRYNSTLQIADGDHIATKTGVLTLSDFRQKHTANGGEGAPMAALVDQILFGHETESRVLLNIGGIANFTWLPAGKHTGNGDRFTTDTGPGNTLIDNLVQFYYQKPYDKEGRIAESGTVHPGLLEVLLSDNWFVEGLTKSTGPEFFNRNWILDKLDLAGIDENEISSADLIATVTELTAVSIARSITSKLGSNMDYTIYTSGGGARNPIITGRLKAILPEVKVRSISDLGIDPDAKEAVIFAVLANEMLVGKGFDFKLSDGSSKKINFGKISFPV